MSEFPHKSSTTPMPPGSAVPNPIASSASSLPPNDDAAAQAEANKRKALAGQWKTPPVTFFPSTAATSTTATAATTMDAATAAPVGSTSSTVAVANAASTIPVASHLPHSTEDYAKALQEAYRQGAEAAARAAARAQQQQLTPATSFPDLQPLSVSSGTNTASASTTTTTTGAVNLPSSDLKPQVRPPTTGQPLAPPPSSSSSLLNQQQHQQQPPSLPLPSHQQQQQSVPMPLSPPPAAAGATGQPMQVQVQLVHHHHHHHPHVNNNNNNASGMAMSTAAATQQQQHGSLVAAAPPSATTSAHTGPPVTTTHHHHQHSSSQQQQQQQQRSISLPDMSTFAAQQEEDKRQKRLARNRASARLRRLRKKNLVEAYELEVSSLEKTLQQLQQHQWGGGGASPPAAAANSNGNNNDGSTAAAAAASNNNGTDPYSANAVAEALSMDRGQQQLSHQERCDAATDILQQQLQFLQQLEDLMQEQYVLQQVARSSVPGAEPGSDGTDEWADLKEVLQLSPEQCEKLVQESAGWEDEWNALQTVKASLQAMKENKWLWNEGCTAVVEQFLSILHKNQISKFLLWADHNAETIDELDGVHATNVVADSPVFQFGVDSNPNELLEDEKMAS